MRNQENFPKENVIDWVYTERPACPDVWYGPKFIAKGCKTELQKIENVQRLRLWDVGEGGASPYARRDDLEITVFSTFASSSEIRAAAFFAPIRSEIYRTLARNLIQLIGDSDAAKELADRLPAWSDYELSFNEGGLKTFRESLLEEAGTILEAERDKFRVAEEEEPVPMLV